MQTPCTTQFTQYYHKQQTVHTHTVKYCFFVICISLFWQQFISGTFPCFNIGFSTPQKNHVVVKLPPHIYARSRITNMWASFNFTTPVLEI